MESDPADDNSGPRRDILHLLDDFIDQIQQLRKIMFGMSVSAIVLAPLAIGLSVYLMVHPSFFGILEIENDFGLVLIILLAAVIIISVIWFATGIRQYRVMEGWKGRYRDYAREKEEIDKKIASRFGLEDN